MYGAKYEHQNSSSPIWLQVTSENFPSGLKVDQFGSSTQTLGEALGRSLGFIDGYEDGVSVGFLLGV